MVYKVLPVPPEQTVSMAQLEITEQQVLPEQTVLMAQLAL
jgi:hypothetical protein